MTEEIRLSKDFILNEVPAAPPLYVSVYMLCLAIEGGNASLIAKSLGVSEDEVLNAIDYWVQKGCGINNKRPQNNRKHALVAQRPDYSSAELAQYIKHEDMKKLLNSAQKRFARPLTKQDMSLLFSFHDWLGLPLDVIEMLLSYCLEDGFKGMNYIEKVAISWAEAGISTVEAAAEYIEMRKTGFGAVMRAFGQGGRRPAAAEEEYMQKWMREYALPLDVICLACERTILQTGKISFKYADSILKKWKEAGVSSLEDIEVLDRAFAAKKEIRSEGDVKKVTAKKQNRFVNYTQRQWDFDRLEQLQRENKEKW